MYREEIEPTISALEQSRSVRGPGGWATVDSYKILKQTTRNLTDASRHYIPN
jgi:hypothetical protein